MINPSIWESTKISRLSRDARLLFIGMFSNADDDGYFRADTRAIRKAIFGMDDLSVDQVGKWVEEVKSMSSVHFYEVEEEQYAHFTNWTKHQTLRGDRLIPSSHPYCPNCTPPRSDSVVTTIRQPSAAKVKVSKGKLIYTPNFDRFWTTYPRKVAKLDAWKSWLRLDPDEKLVGRIIKALDVAKKSPEWVEKAGKFIPYPATWLNKRRFDDELPPDRQAMADKAAEEAVRRTDRMLAEVAVRKGRASLPKKHD